ncbi:MAG: glycosyltransferase [Planctomycetota bacterium]
MCAGARVGHCGERGEASERLPSREPAGQGCAPLTCSAVLTHHWLVRIRGGEKVLEALAELLPNAPIHALVHDPGGIVNSPLAARQVRASPLQRVPGAVRHYPKLLPLLPWAARRVHLPEADLVVCSDAAVAKAMRPHPRSRVVCYCHSPPRYVWDAALAAEYRRSLPAVLRPLWAPLAAYIRRADRQAAARVHTFVANSRHVAGRIWAWYGRESVVVYPPVEIPAEPARGPRAAFYLAIGHHTPYKRLDLAVAACGQLGRRLVVIGDGPEVERLRRQSTEHVTWLGHQPDAVVHDHYRRAAALLFPGEEDFGMVPVEAMGHGCPVIAYGAGGATETVVPGRTGLLFTPQTADALAAAVTRFEQLRFDADELHAEAARFSRPRFLREMRDVLVAALADTPQSAATA